MRQAAIESASVEMLEVFDLVSNEAKREKSAVPPINKLVYYWTRKPLIVGRAVALACTLENPEDVKELLELNKDSRAYKWSPNKTKYEELLGRNPSQIQVLDPFAGAGNLAFPSVELGLSVTCSDYNPLAYIIERGALEFPSLYGHTLAKEFEDAANCIISDVEKEVGQFYKPRHLAYLWVWCIRCNHCGQRVPLLNQMYLSVKNSIGLQFTPTQDKNFTVNIIRNMSKKEGRSFTQRYGKAQCISCSNAIKYDTMTKDITKNKDKEMIAIQIQKSNGRGRDYILPTTNDKEQYYAAKQFFETNQNCIIQSIPREEILAHHRKRNTLWIYGIYKWDEFYSDRQKLVLSTLVKKINSHCDKISDSPHISALRIYLSFLIARLVDSYSYGVRWHTSRDMVGPTLSLRQPSTVFNRAEINPFEKVGGSLRNNIHNIIKGIEFCARLKDSTISCKRESVTVPSDKQYDVIITDPPYRDDVQYGELSEFFYLWMRSVIHDDTLPARAPLEEDFCESWGRFGDKQLASEFFEKGLRASFVSINQKLKDDGILAVFFAHSSIQAWNQLLMSLRAGSFRVVSSYALHTEMTTNLLARNKASFMSSIVVVCRKITDTSSGFIEDIIPDVEDSIREILQNISSEKLLAIPITDLLIMVYGKVLESCTKYRTLKSRSGDRKPDFESLLSNAQYTIMRLLVLRLTKYSINTIGPPMAFYILVKIFQGGRASADDMLKITKAYNIEPHMLENLDVITKDGNSYRLIPLHKNEMDFPPENVEQGRLHQQLCYLAHQVEIGKAKTVNEIANMENFRRDSLKQIIHLVLKSLNIRKNRGESLDSDERREVHVLQTLADTMGVQIEGGLDAFMSE